MQEALLALWQWVGGGKSEDLKFAKLAAALAWRGVAASNGSSLSAKDLVFAYLFYEYFNITFGLGI